MALLRRRCLIFWMGRSHYRRYLSVGKLQMVPCRRYRLSQNMSNDSKGAFIPPDEAGSIVGVLNLTVQEVQNEAHDAETVIKQAAVIPCGIAILS